MLKQRTVSATSILILCIVGVIAFVIGDSATIVSGGRLVSSYSHNLLNMNVILGAMFAAVFGSLIVALLSTIVLGILTGIFVNLSI